MQEKSLKNQTAIITGADRGVGRGIAIEMAKAGANIVIACKDLEMAKIAKQEIEKHNSRVVIIPTDITQETQRKSLFEKSLKQFGHIDILVNNAGINPEKSFLDNTDTDTLKTFATNLLGPISLTRTIAHYMMDNQIKGNILFTSSTHSHITSTWPAYSATKAALEMYVKEIALELAEKEIRVNAVAPGVVAIKGEINTTTNDVPMGSACLPEDIGQAMVFLASNHARFITGQTLIVDGGFSLAHFHYWKKKSHR
jgi:NAD(P)-dependent dehydrogenase (short-subunit alcohol dehydrogenase family)